MDIKDVIEKTVKKIQGDPKLLKGFQDNPEKTVESVAGVDIPDGMLSKVVDGVKAKIKLDSVGGVVDKIKDIFGK